MAQRYQKYGTVRSVADVPAGTTLNVRTTETINANDSDGRVFGGVVDQDVRNRNGAVVIPRGADVELIVREVSNNEIALDLEAVTVNGQRYALESENSVVNADRREGIGANERTGKYVGGGAALGAIIGAIAGGGKGAAIGAGVGAAGGAATQVLTRGGSVRVPSETLLTFRLQEPLRSGIQDNGYTQNGIHYHPGYAASSTASREKSGYYGNGQASVRIDRDNNVSWNGPSDARVYVQVDNQPMKLFAAAPTGTQAASWIDRGHLYTFVMTDSRGNEITREQLDLRNSRTQPGYSGVGSGNVRIGQDNNIRWDGPPDARVYVQVDNEPWKLFAAGQSGTQAATWIEQGHTYAFIMTDSNGNEITRDQLDLRGRSRRNRR